MTIAVAGVSGNTGRVVAETLLDQGQPLRVIVRDAAKGAPWKARGAEVALADLGDAAALTQALRGARAAYLLVPPTHHAPSFRDYQNRIVRSLVDAVQAAALPELVFLSSIGAQHAAGTGPIVALHSAEQLFSALPTRTTFLRAAYFMENLAGSLSLLDKGLLTSFFPANFAVHMVATLDIGRLAARVLSEGNQATQVLQLSGQTPVTMNDAAAALAKLTRKPIQVAEAPLEQMVPTLTAAGFTADLARLYQEMTAAIVSGLVAFDERQRHVRGSVQVEQVLAKLIDKG